MKAKNNQKISKYETVEKGIQYDNQNKKYLLTLYIGKDKKGKQVRKFEMFTRLDEARKRKKEFQAEKRLNKAPKALEKIKLDSFLNCIIIPSLVVPPPLLMDIEEFAIVLKHIVFQRNICRMLKRKIF